MVPLLEGYRDWFRRIIDPKVVNSTADHVNAAISRHNTAMKTLAATDTGKRLGVRAESPYVPDLSAPVTKVVQAIDLAWLEGRVFDPSLKYLEVRTYSSLGQRIESLSPEYSVTLLTTSFDEKRHEAVYNSRTAPMRRTVLETPFPAVAKAATQSDLSKSLEQSPQWTTMKEDCAEFASQVDKANAERLRIAAYTAVVGAAAISERTTLQWIQRFGGAA
jgi:hypothetical protein